MNSTTSTTSTTTTCPVTTVTNAGEGTITTGATTPLVFSGFRVCECHLCRIDTNITQHVFFRCLTNDDIFGCLKFGSLNKQHCVLLNEVFQNKLKEADLIQICPKLTIFDGKAQGENIDDEPAINSYRMISLYKKLSAHADLTVLTICKDCTLEKVVAYAKSMKIEIEIDEDVLTFFNNKFVINDTYRLLITSNPIQATVTRLLERQDNIVCEIAGFESKPCLEENLLLVCVQKVFQCKVGSEEQKEGTQTQISWRTSTQWYDCYMEIKPITNGFAVCMRDNSPSTAYSNLGAGGCTKL